MKKIHRFFLPTDLAHQLRDVLKMEVGEEIDLLDGAGIEARAKIIQVKPQVEVELTSIQQKAAANTKTILYCAILKRENFELVVQKATEVGVNEIVPIITERTIKTGIKLDRLQKIAAEAAEQSGRVTIPNIHEPLTFKQALVDAARNDQNLFLDPSGTPQKTTHSGSVGLFIGPEGGWTEKELNEAKQSGCVMMSLGQEILRGETAAIIGTYLTTHNII